MDERLLPIKNLEFTIDVETQKIIIKLLNLQKILNKNKLSKRKRKKLEIKKEKLIDDFRFKLHTLNPVQIIIVRKFLNNN